MLVSFALVSALVAPATGAPPATTPAEVAPAPAPAPAEIAPAPAQTTVVVTTTTHPTPAPIIIQAPAAPVVATQPPPPPEVSPPAPTWAYVPQPPAAPDPARTMTTIRTFRRNALGVFTVGGLGMAGALGLQYARARSLQRCIDTGSASSSACATADGMEMGLSGYSRLGLAIFVVGSGGAGAMLGNAAATRDVQLRGGNIRSRSGAKLLGLLTIGATSAWMIGANYTLLRHEGQCDGDPRCIARYRPLRWAANDGAAVGIGAGVGLMGWAIAYERQGKALMHLRAAPSLSARHRGLSLTMTF